MTSPLLGSLAATIGRAMSSVFLDATLTHIGPHITDPPQVQDDIGAVGTKWIAFDASEQPTSNTFVETLGLDTFHGMGMNFFTWPSFKVDGTVYDLVVEVLPGSRTDVLFEILDNSHGSQCPGLFRLIGAGALPTLQYSAGVPFTEPRNLKIELLDDGYYRLTMTFVPTDTVNRIEGIQFTIGIDDTADNGFYVYPRFVYPGDGLGSMTFRSIVVQEHDDPAEPNPPSETTYSCKAIEEVFGAGLLAQGLVNATDVKLLILASTLATAPLPGDRITIRGVTYTIVPEGTSGLAGVVSDPARATWSCRATK